MASQYIRKCKLVVGDPTGKAIDLSALRIRFYVWQGTTQAPRHASIRVYNLSDDTVGRVQNEFTQLQLQTGYEDGSLDGLISGSLIQKRDGRENTTDTFLEMLVQDGDTAYNQCVVSQTLAAGWSYPDVHQSILKALAPYEISAGTAPEFPATYLPRGKVMFGMARDHLRTLGASTKSQWHFETGKINFVPIDGYLGDPSKALVLTSATGLIGMPTQTIDGIVVQCLLNANIKVGTLIKLDNKSIQKAAYSPDYQAINENLPSLADDGIYKVLAVSHRGDTRGQEWYSDIVCTSRFGIQPFTQRTIAAVP